MPFMTVPEAAIRWHISVSELRELCENHMISGAVRVHQRWFIPETAACPSAQHPAGRTSDQQDFEIPRRPPWPRLRLSSPIG